MKQRIQVTSCPSCDNRSYKNSKPTGEVCGRRISIEVNGKHQEVECRRIKEKAVFEVELK